MDLLHPVIREFGFFLVVITVSNVVTRTRGWWRPLVGAAVATAVHVWIGPLFR